MAHMPQLAVSQRESLYTQTFLGLNLRPRTQDGEMAWMENLTADGFPVLQNRRKRGKAGELEAPAAVLMRDALCTVEGSAVKYGGETVQGVTLDPETQPKRLVSMGAYICIFPDCKYFNVYNPSDCGDFGKTWTGTGATVAMVRQDGTQYAAGDITFSTTPPQNPTNGQLWMDTSEETHVLKQYAEYTRMWVEVASVYAGIFKAGIGAGFSEYDTVTLSGMQTATGTEDVQRQSAELNGDHIIYQVSEDCIVVAAGALDQSYTTGEIRVERWTPEMEHVIECGNRLWGCHYGLNRDGAFVNEIYASALGDMKNWRRYMGVSTDSYAVSVGTDGPFTGAVAMGGTPVFFKEHALHRISGEMPSNYRMETTPCRGVQEGSWRSVRVVGEVAVYKSANGVMCYDGSIPYAIGDSLGDEIYTEAAAGVKGNKYYLSMKDPRDEWHLFVWDSMKQLWHREDGLHVTEFAGRGNGLYMLGAPDDEGVQTLWTTEAGAGEAAEEKVSWTATFGVYGYELEQQKYISRVNLRAWMAKGSWMRLEIQYDSDGCWRDEGTVRCRETGTMNMPVIPRRCDHLQLRLSGEGDFKLFSVGRQLERGSDVRSGMLMSAAEIRTRDQAASRGEKGEDGATFYPYVDEDGTIWWTNNGDLPNPAPVNVKGADGQPGAKGEPGTPGPKGDPGDDYVLTEADKAEIAQLAATEVEEPIDELKGAVGYGCDNFISGYYPLSNTIYTVNFGHPVADAAYVCGYFPCVPGDQFTLTGTGASGAKLWAWCNGKGDVLNRSSNQTAAGIVITAPNNAYFLVVNAQVAYPYSLERTAFSTLFAATSKQAEQIQSAKNTESQLLAFDGDFLSGTVNSDRITANAVVNGELYVTADGKIDVSAAFTRSKYLIPFYAPNAEAVVSDNNVNVYAVCYDKDMSFIGSTTIRPFAATSAPPVGIIPAGTFYIGLDIRDGSAQSISITRVSAADAIKHPYTDYSYLASTTIDDQGTIYTNSAYGTVFISVTPGDRYYTNATLLNNFVCFSASGACLGLAAYTEIAYNSRIYTIPANAVYCVCNLQYNKTHGNGVYSTVICKITQSKKVLCIGDSLTFLDNQRNTAYDGASLFLGWQKQLEYAGYEVASAGYSGYTYAVVSGTGSIYTEVVTNQMDVSGYDIIILSGGVNDDYYDVPVGDVPSTYQATYDPTTMCGALGGILAYIRANNTTAKIILATPTKAESASRPFSEAKLYAQAVRDMANYGSCYLQDNFAQMNVQPFTAGFTATHYDTVHPNKTGMEILGRLMLKAVEDC